MVAWCSFFILLVRDGDVFVVVMGLAGMFDSCGGALL